MRRPAASVAAALLLPAAVAAAYWPALRGGYVWDDDAHVTRPDLRSLHGLWRIWFEPGATQQYYPVLHGAFWAEHRLWGDSALGYHGVNIVLHLVSVLLLYRLLRRLAVPGALLGASVFALHPVCAESVAWVSEQKNTLSTALVLAAALAYLRFDAERRPWRYALAFGLFILAVLSKSVTGTLPAALLVLLWWKKGRLSWANDIAPLVPWLGVGATGGAVTAWMERTYIGAHGAAFGLSSVDRCLVAGRALWFYLGKLLWPADLSFIYPRWTVDARASWQYLFPAAALAGLALLFALRDRARGPLAAALLYAGLLFPALGFVNVYPFVFSFVADHFQYLAAAALLPALCAGLALLAGRRGGAGRAAGQGAAVGLLALLGILTWRQCGHFRDMETFYRSILAGNPASWLAHDNLGVVLVQRGEVGEATAHFQEAMRLNPDYPEAFNDYGNVLAREGRWVEAGEAYAGALRARPSFAAAEKNWGVAMENAGLSAGAEQHFRNALGILPDYAEAHYQLGNALGNSGQLPEAMEEYRAAIRLQPDYPEAHANLGLALAGQRRWAEALAEIGEAIRQRPGYAEAHAYDGLALAGSGRLAEAAAEYRRALGLDPGNGTVHYQLALVLHQLGQTAAAEAEREAARRAGVR